jgi:OmpA-OmpF porin, OOP family
MKKLFLLCLTLSSIFIAKGQSGNNKMYTKRPALGIHFIMNDFRTASLIRNSSINSVLTSKTWSKPRDMAPGLAVTYVKGMNDHIDVQARLAGSFLDLPIPGRNAFNTDFFFLEGDASVLLKMLSDRYAVSPYILAGIGASRYKSGYYGAFLPIGGGLQVNFLNEAFIQIATEYRVPVSGNNNYHLFHSIGIAGNIGKKRETPVRAPAL